MLDLKTQLKLALENALPGGTHGIEVVIQDVPDNKPGDYGSPVAFQLAKALGQNPAQVAAQIASSVVLPVGIDRVEAVGPFLNFFVDPASFVSNVVTSSYTPEPKRRKVIIEHTSVNPNKEWHVGHIRGALIGDALGRIYRAAGYDVEIQNYIDDTGRQAAESLFAVKHYKAVYDPSKKYDHWLGELYVRLHKDLDDPETKAKLEPEIAEVIHALERGELRTEIEKIVKSQLETAFSLGVEYDLLTWESDVVGAGFVAKALEILESSPHLQRPTEGPFAGTLGIDVSAFAPGQEEPYKVLVRSNGTFVYVTKDIGFHYWKFGLFEGLEYKPFEAQPSGKELWTSAPHGEHEPAGHRFAHANEVINVIDARQALQQVIVKAALAILEYGQEHAENFHHLANETVLLEGKTMSGRKGITVSADEVIVEAKSRAVVTMNEISPELVARKPEYAKIVANQVGIGALKFAFLKAEPKRQIDFRWEQALALQGDTAVVVHYAHARIRSIARKAQEAGFVGAGDWSKIGPLELKLARTVAKYPEVLALCVRDNTPHPMCAYALELATEFNAYYNHKGADGKADTSVLHAPEGLREARLALVVRVADAIKEALGVLGIEAPDEM
jgi:arginyl-tRNA synthetase